MYIYFPLDIHRMLPLYILIGGIISNWMTKSKNTKDEFRLAPFSVGGVNINENITMYIKYFFVNWTLVYLSFFVHVFCISIIDRKSDIPISAYGKEKEYGEQHY